VPLAKGGKNAMENYQLAHKACNEAKGSMLPKEHMKIIRYNRRRILLMRIKKGIVVW
jgi:5-methylcytosine-specific restriction endonuclease McrA